MNIVTIQDMKKIIKKHTIPKLIKKIVIRLKKDFEHRENFTCSARFAHYVDEGVVELMPIGNKDFFSYKYVNGHPGNITQGYSSIMALGQLSDCHTGKPLIISEMTILTALRTAATTQLVAKYAALSDSSVLCVIGNGSQSVFQTIAICEQFAITRIQYYDVDISSMQIYANHIASIYPHIKLISAIDSHQAAQFADIIITVTEQFGCHNLVSLKDLKPGVFIAGIGGDTPNKTELDADLVDASSVIVEYEPQTRIEGEIQHYVDKKIHAHIREIVQEKKQARKSKEEIILFDSVGFAIEDYSALQVLYKIVSQNKKSKQIELTPNGMKNLKDLYGYTLENI